MSLNYASSLSPCPDKGKCGQAEVFDSYETVKDKCTQLARLINESRNIVAITGAGISTSCGIPDFRGPKGVWTLEQKGEIPNINVSFETAIPSYAHFALVTLEKLNKLNFLVSQNIDGLHHRSGFPLNKLAELHGNMFFSMCNQCQTKRLTDESVKTVGLKPIGKKCTKEKKRGVCRGEYCDMILDWEDALPSKELELSELNFKKADLCLCLGTSLQIMPCGNFPLLLKKNNNNNGKIVIINLQKTRMDKHADLVINYKLDFVFKLILNELNIKNQIKNKIILESIHTSIENERFLIKTDNIMVNIKNEESENNSFKIDMNPNLILLFTGKRKSGKDYSVEKLIDKLKQGNLIEKITLSAPLKSLYAQENNINYEKLLDSSDYKEKYRKDMIRWGEEKRKQNPSYFCQIAIDYLKVKVYKNDGNFFLVWIVTDARRHSDLEFFKQNYSSDIIMSVRVSASDETRISRGWVFTKGVDDAPSECDLDDIKDWDFNVLNNNNQELEESLSTVCVKINKLKSKF